MTERCRPSEEDWVPVLDRWALWWKGSGSGPMKSERAQVGPGVWLGKLAEQAGGGVMSAGPRGDSQRVHQVEGTSQRTPQLSLSSE